MVSRINLILKSPLILPICSFDVTSIQLLNWVYAINHYSSMAEQNLKKFGQTGSFSEFLTLNYTALNTALKKWGLHVAVRTKLDTWSGRWAGDLWQVAQTSPSNLLTSVITMWFILPPTSRPDDFNSHTGAAVWIEELREEDGDLGWGEGGAQRKGPALVIGWDRNK